MPSSEPGQSIGGISVERAAALDRQTLQDAADERDPVDNLFEANERLRAENAALQAQLAKMLEHQRYVGSAYADLMKSHETLQAQLAVGDRLKEAAWAFKMSVYSLPGTAPNGSGRLIDWLKSQSAMFRDATPDLQIAYTHDRLIDAIRAWDALAHLDSHEKP